MTVYKTQLFSLFIYSFMSIDDVDFGTLRGLGKI